MQVQQPGWGNGLTAWRGTEQGMGDVPWLAKPDGRTTHSGATLMAQAGTERPTLLKLRV